MEKGVNVLIVYDDLTHTRTHGIGRSPSAAANARDGEAYPGDISLSAFALMERAYSPFTRPGRVGSLLRCQIIETQAQKSQLTSPNQI